jgi:hypothetical protein
MILFLGKRAHSVRVDPSSSRPTCSFLLVLVHVSLSLLSTDCLSPSLLRGRARPHPLPPSCPHYPQVPGKRPIVVSGTVISCLACWYMSSVNPPNHTPGEPVGNRLELNKASKVLCLVGLELELFWNRMESIGAVVKYQLLFKIEKIFQPKSCLECGPLILYL